MYGLVIYLDKNEELKEKQLVLFKEKDFNGKISNKEIEEDSKII